MKKYILAFLLLLLMTSLTLGWDLSLATGLSVKNALLYLILMIWFVETAALHNRELDLPSVLVPYALIVAYAMSSWFVMSFVLQPAGYDFFAAAIALKNEVVDHFIVFVIFFFGLSTTRDALSLVRFLIWMTMVGNLLTVVDAFDMPDLGIIDQRDDGRVSGPVGESNAYGAFIATTLPGCVALAVDSRGYARLLAILGTFVTIVALFLTSSRGAFVGLFAGGLFTIFYLRQYVSLKGVTWGIALIVVSVVSTLVVFYSTGYLSLLEERFVEQSTGNAYDATSSRSEIWKLAILRILEYPHSLLTGFGWDAYDHMRGLFQKSTHNFYLNKLFNLGLPGLLLYLALFHNIVSACRRALPHASDETRLHLMACVFGSASLGGAIFFIDLHAPWIFIWAYLGLSMRLAVESWRKSPAASPAAVLVPMRQSRVRRTLKPEGT